MREYLINFFHTFEYEDADSEYLLSTYDKIAGNDDTIAVWNEAINIYERDTNCDFKLIISLCAYVYRWEGDEDFFHRYRTLSTNPKDRDPLSCEEL